MILLQLKDVMGLEVRKFICHRPVVPSYVFGGRSANENFFLMRTFKKAAKIDQVPELGTG